MATVIYLAAGLLAVILVLVAVIVYERRHAVELLERFAKQWEAERRELITRIQRPDLVPIARRRAPVGDGDDKPRDTAALHAVGRVAHGDGPSLPSQADLED